MTLDPKKLLGVLVPPKGATHCIVHSVDELGKMGPKLSLEVDGKVFDYWNLREISREWIVANFGPGTYRLQWVGVNDATGSRKKLGSSGGFILEEEPPKVVQPRAAMPAAIDDGGDGFQGGEFRALRLYRTIESEIRAREQADYDARTQRDRLFFGAMLQAVSQGRTPDVRAAIEASNGVTPAAAPADDDDDEDDDPVLQGVKAFAREFAPTFKEIALAAIAKTGGGTSGAPA